MTDILNPLNYFWKLGYREVSQNVYQKRYPGQYTIKVDLAKELIDYGDKIRLGDIAFARFTQRNYVIVECADRLLLKGYRPSSLYMGFTNECDIAIKAEPDDWLIAIRCRRWDDKEYDKEVEAVKVLQSRPVLPASENKQFQFLCVYASTLRSGLIDYGYTMFPLTAGNCAKPDHALKGRAVSSTTGLFEEEIEAYHPIIVEKTNQQDKTTRAKATSGSSEFEIENGELIRYLGNGKLVAISKGVKKLRNGVFWDRPEIMKVTIPDTVTNLGGETFSDCTNLVNLTIPRHISVIGDNPFSNCPALILKNESPDFILEDGALYDRTKTRLIYYSMSNTASVFEIPDSIISIGKHAIHGCSALRKITIPPSVAIVENNPFSSCPSLSLVNNSPYFVFENDALYDKNRTSIFYFAINSSSKSFAIPEGVTTIQRHSFFGCVNLSNVTLPSTLEVIGYNPFANCPSLSLTNNSPNFVYENGVLYNRSKTKLVYYSMRNPEEEFVIPGTVRTIGRNAFFGCGNLRSATLPDRVALIGKGAFANCVRLEKAKIPRSVIQIEDWAFYNCPNLAVLEVPKNVSIADHAFSRSHTRLTRS